jgi:hypothetical protein
MPRRAIPLPHFAVPARVDPPYDDEGVMATHSASVSHLPLRGREVGGPLDVPQEGPRARRAPAPHERHGQGGPALRGPYYVQGTLALEPEPGDPGRALVFGPAGAPPDERRLRALGQAVAEVLAGRRPPRSVARHLTERAHADLLRVGKVIDARRPPFVGVPHVCQPSEDVLEMCLLVHCGHRPRMLALRLERRGVQWLCTDFETTP